MKKVLITAAVSIVVGALLFFISCLIVKQCIGPGPGGNEAISCSQATGLGEGVFSIGWPLSVSFVTFGNPQSAQWVLLIGDLLFWAVLVFLCITIFKFKKRDS